VLELALVHRLASLLWRLRRASAIETGLFETQGEFLLAQRQSSGCVDNRELSEPPPDSMVMVKCRARTDRTSRRPATEKRYQRPCIRRSNQARSPAPSPNVSCASPILTRPCLTAWAATKRDCGAKRRRQSGRLTL
jgi:hypothetical protein